ncbi:MAG: hypothetical protein QOI47_2643 [Actinomycetota bacterium]|nr:hypothetical protein [Actinomycetota bacterium]
MTATHLAVGLLVSAALVWVLFLVALVVVRPRGISVRDAKRFVPDVVSLVRGLAGDSTLPRGVRRRLGALLFYLALPIDLVPDFIPVLGYADDVIVIAWVLRSTVRAAGPSALDRHWRGSAAGLALVRRIAGVT